MMRLVRVSHESMITSLTTDMNSLKKLTQLYYFLLNVICLFRIVHGLKLAIANEITTFFSRQFGL